MKPYLRILVICLTYIFVTSVSIAGDKKHEHDQAHEHSEGSDLGLTLNAGHKWKTDEPLRQGMQSIHQVMMKAEPAFNSDSLTQEEGEALATHVNEQLIYLVNNCELEPAADETLHVLIGEMMQGVGALSKGTEAAGGFSRIHNALQHYPKFFDHSDWEK